MSSVAFDLIPEEEEVQTIVYLYELNQWGIGTLITHGARTFRNVKVNEKISVSLDLTLNSYNVRKGSRLAVVIDAGDSLYTQPQKNEGHFKIVHDGESKLKLYLP